MHEAVIQEVDELIAELSKESLEEGFRDFLRRARTYGRKKVERFVGYLRAAIEYLETLVRTARMAVKNAIAHRREKRRLHKQLKALQKRSKVAQDFAKGQERGEAVAQAMKHAAADADLDAYLIELDDIIEQGEKARKRAEKLLARHEKQQVDESAADMIRAIIEGSAPEDLAEGRLRDAFSKAKTSLSSVGSTTVGKFLDGVKAVAKFLSSLVRSPIRALAEKLQYRLSGQESEDLANKIDNLGVAGLRTGGLRRTAEALQRANEELWEVLDGAASAGLPDSS